MSIRTDKQDIFTTIGAYTSLAEELKGTIDDVVQKIGDAADAANEYSKIGRSAADTTTNLFTSINNKDDIGGFLIDVLGVVVGTTGLKDLIGQLFTNFTDNIEGTLKEVVSKQLTSFNSGNDLSDYDWFVNGLSVPVKDVDVYGLFKSSPDTDAGSLLYDTAVENFNNKAFAAIVAEGSYVDMFDFLSIRYNANDDTFTFKPQNTAGTVGEWVNGYIEQAPMINKKEFIANIMDRVYGAITTNSDKTTEQLFDQLQIDKLLEQVIGGNESYIISEEDYADLLKKAEELYNGVVYYDMGCGVIEAELPLSAMTSFMATVSGSTDPYAVAEATDATVSISYSGDAETTGDENAETIRNGFFARLIEFLKLELSKLLTTSPQARMLLALTSAFANEGIPQISDPREDLKKFKTYIKCTIDDVLASLYEFMFYLIVGILVALLVPIIKTIILEKINQFLGILKSLISNQIEIGSGGLNI